MPIRNIDLRKQHLPKIMNIRKGIKVPVMDRKTNKPKLDERTGEIVTRPKEVSYFVFHFDDSDDETKSIIESVYGDEPDKINAFLAYDDKDKTWDYWFEAYIYGQLVARSDGVVITLLFDITNGQRLIERGQVCAIPDNPESTAGRLIVDNNLGVGDILSYYEDMVVATTQSGRAVTFDAVGRLSIIIPEVGRYATATVHTGGLWHDVPHITEMVERVFEIASGINRPPNLIPVILTRVPYEMSYKDPDGKAHKRTTWNIQMEIAPQIFKGLLKAYHDTPVALLAAEPPPQLAPPVDMFGENEPTSPYLVDGVSEDWQDDVVSQNQGEPPIEQESKAIPRKPSKRETEKPSGPVGILMDLDEELNTFRAANIATKLQLTSDMSIEVIDNLYSSYRTLRDNDEYSPDEAAAMVLD